MNQTDRTNSPATDTAAESGKWVAAVGQEQAKTVASTAAEEAAHVASEAGNQARSLLDESKSQLRTQARSQTDQIASKLREFGDQVHALVEGRTEEAGPVADYARQAAQSVTQFAGRLEHRGFDGMVEDVQRFARRKPGTFLVGAALAGFGIGRLLRSGAMTTESSSTSEETRSVTGPDDALYEPMVGSVEPATVRTTTATPADLSAMVRPARDDTMDIGGDVQ